MKNMKKVRQTTLLKAGFLAAATFAATAASAQITRGFIGPHEYALPVKFEPFNIFVEYATVQKNSEAWNSAGDNVGGDRTRSIVALSKYVRLWTPESNPNIGLAWEIIVPKVGVQNRASGTSTGGIADPITGGAIWYKPADNWTLGADLFVQVPVGDKDVGGGDRWNLIGSAFWDGQFGAVNYTGNLGFTVPGSPTVGLKPGKSYYTNHRLGYRMSELVEPYVGLDYERQSAAAANLANHELGAAIGVMFHTYKHSHISVHYQKGLRGENRPASNNLNIRFAYVF